MCSRFFEVHSSSSCVSFPPQRTVGELARTALTNVQALSGRPGLPKPLREALQAASAAIRTHCLDEEPPGRLNTPAVVETTARDTLSDHRRAHDSEDVGYHAFV